ncbi:MAG TPA: M1 family aminopeptidase, partial [Chitinophagaceae bacterium]|nr:M1 family aminopeptidase [Chitinophagaceae bacterium]
ESKYRNKQDQRFTQRSEQSFLETFIVEKKDQPIATVSEDFTATNYGLIAYYKASQWMTYLEKKLGTDIFNKAMQEYYRQWQFKHPQPEDLKKVLEDVSGQKLDSAFALLQQKGNLPGREKKGIVIQGPLGGIKGVNSDKKTVVTLLPAVGINSYDKLMAGLTITNLRFPPNRIQFLLLPMYGFGSKNFTGIGFINYSGYPKRTFRKIDVGVSGSAFTIDRFEDNDNNKTFLSFSKIVPGIRLTLKEKKARSQFNRFIQFKSFLFNEEALRFYRDTVITGIDTTISTKYRTIHEGRTLNQLQFVIENNRALYPYRGELKVEQGKDFIRTAFTGRYFFNYAKEGGLNVRLFAGKFFYSGSKTISKQFATDRYHLNMTGANGYEDYTYSDYFIGRNEFEGISSQQIMERDGAFKVRTDLLAEKVGRTDDWLVAANFSTTIPSSVNPLTLLPVKIPLKLFFDIGTYAEAWKQNAEADRFLFDAGLHIPLLKETVNIYIPLIYSSVYRDYIQSTIEKKGRFWKKISFSIDISNFSFRKIDRNLDF